MKHLEITTGPHKTTLKVDAGKLIDVTSHSMDDLIEVREGGTSFDGKSFWLNNIYNWTIGLDAGGETILVPVLK